MGPEQNTNGAHHQRGGTRDAVGFQCVQHLIGVLNQKSFWNWGRVLFLVFHKLRLWGSDCAYHRHNNSVLPFSLLLALPHQAGCYRRSSPQDR